MTGLIGSLEHRTLLRLLQKESTRRSSERAPAGTPSGDADLAGGWLPSLTFHVGPCSSYASPQARPFVPEATLHQLRRIRGAIRVGWLVRHLRLSARQERLFHWRMRHWIRRWTRGFDPAAASVFALPLPSVGFPSAVFNAGRAEAHSFSLHALRHRLGHGHDGRNGTMKA
jgi:hypothetical protein